MPKLWPVVFLLLTCTARGGEAFSPQPPGSLEPMLRITWARGPNLPQGLQDSDGGFVGNVLVTVGGYCGGGLDRDKREKPGVYPSGFLRKGWGLDMAGQARQWEPIPDFPGAPRQALFAAAVEDQLYLWGGFSYEAPFAYADGWRLARTASGWAWQPLPALPWRIAAAGATVIGRKIYVFGGADYDTRRGFHTAADRDGGTARLGARLIVLDTEKLDAGWKELPSCPGTPRFAHAVQAAGGRIYVIGGAAIGPQSCTVVDNWRFDPATEQWSRLRDLPIASGNFPRGSSLLFANRYIILPGGYQYGLVLDPDGATRPPYGKPTSRNPASGLYSDVFVYDTHNDTFGTADKLPIDNNLPMTVVRDDRIYLIGGETGGGVVEGEYYGHHPELLLIGRIDRIEGR